MFIAKKPCSFAGKNYRIDDPIPDGAVLKEAITRLKNGGYIAEKAEGPLLPSDHSLEKATIAVPTTEKELMSLTRARLAEFASFYGKTVEEEDTKRMLTAFILKAQAGSDE